MVYVPRCTDFTMKKIISNDSGCMCPTVFVCIQSNLIKVIFTKAVITLLKSKELKQSNKRFILLITRHFFRPPRPCIIRWMEKADPHVIHAKSPTNAVVGRRGVTRYLEIWIRAQRWEPTYQRANFLLSIFSHTLQIVASGTYPSHFTVLG